MTDTTLNRWSPPDSYFGEAWLEYYRSGFGRSRDSDCLEESNFNSALAALGGESETVQVVRESHWAVGWVEWIAIHESDDKAIAIAEGLNERRDDYPVLDEEDFSNRETESADEIWRDCYDDVGRIAYMRDRREQFEFNDWRDMRACARGEYFAGDASELNHS